MLYPWSTSLKNAARKLEHILRTWTLERVTWYRQADLIIESSFSREIARSMIMGLSFRNMKMGWRKMALYSARLNFHCQVARQVEAIVVKQEHGRNWKKNWERQLLKLSGAIHFFVSCMYDCKKISALSSQDKYILNSFEDGCTGMG